MWPQLPYRHLVPGLSRACESLSTICGLCWPAAELPVSQQHVQDGRKENLEGFVRTFQKELPEDAHAGVFALDCEMVSLGLRNLGPLWEEVKPD